MTTNYINTDLDLVAPCALHPLTAVLEVGGVSPLYLAEEENGHWYATLETAANYADPEAAISAMLDAIEALQGEAYDLWTGCSVRKFDIGYRCGNEPFSFQQEITNATLLRMSQRGAGLKITLYGSATTNSF